jgi:hypothetical protein
VSSPLYQIERQLQRIVWLHREAIEGRFPNCTTASEVFVVSTKTIQRDFDAMRKELLLPLVYDPARYGWCYTVQPPDPLRALLLGMLEDLPTFTERVVRREGKSPRRFVATYDPAKAARQFLEVYGFA